MKKILFAGALTTLMVALGCVIRTESKIEAHITLDIRHISDQASSVLDFVEGKSDALPGIEQPAPPKDEKEKAKTAAPGKQSWAGTILRSLDPFPAAYADQLAVTTSPLVTEIASRMRARNGQVAAFKASGCFGESNRGHIELRDCDGLKDPEKRNEAQKLMAEENKDRKALYNEITRLNNDQGVNVTTVESIYAMERLDRASSGEAHQLPDSGPYFNKVKQSALGQKLGAKCQPGVWIIVP